MTCEWELATDIETTAIRLGTVVSTLQIMIEAKDETDPDFAAAVAGQRDTVTEQAKRLEKIARGDHGKQAA